MRRPERVAARTNSTAQLLVGEVVLAQEVDVGPGEHGMAGDRGEEGLLLPGVAQRGELVLEVEVVPADDAVLDQPVARLGDLLTFLLGLQELPRAAHRHVTGEAVGQLDPAELLLDRLPQGQIIEIAQDEQ
jgi:hypothetical protein